MTVEEEGVEESLNPVFDLLGPERHFLMTLPPQVKNIEILTHKFRFDNNIVIKRNV